MATQSVEQMIRDDMNMNIHIECSICLQEFKNPKLLPCLHTFCLQCIKKYCDQKGSYIFIPCPLCKKEFQVPRGGVENFSDNISMNRLVLDRVLPEAKRDQTGCEKCMTRGELVRAESFCVECIQGFCDKCSKLHAKSKLGRTHNIITIDEQQKEDELIVLTRLTSGYCDKHCATPIESYCSDCKLLICGLCHTSYHYKHQCRKLRDILKERKEIVVKDVNDVEKFRFRAAESMKDLEEENKDFLDQISSAKSDVKKKIGSIRQFLEICEDELLKDLASKKTDGVKDIKSKKLLVKQRCTAIDGFLEYSKTINKSETDFELIQTANDLHKKAIELIRENTELDNRDINRNTVKFIPSQNPFVENIQLLVGIFQHSTGSSKSSVGAQSTSEAMQLSPVITGVTGVDDEISVTGEAQSQLNAHDSSSGSERRDSNIPVSPAGYISVLGDEIRVTGEAQSQLNAQDLSSGSERRNINIPVSPADCTQASSVPRPRVGIIQHSKNILGVTVVDEEIFVLRKAQSELNVYESHSLIEAISIHLPGMKSPWCLAGCAFNKALYISDYELKCIHRVSLAYFDKPVTRWSLRYYYSPLGLSVTAEHRLLVNVVTSRTGGESAIVEYTSEGQEIRVIKLDRSINYAHQTVQLSSDQFIVSHGWQDSDMHRICVVDTLGVIIKSSGRSGARGGWLRAPFSIAIDSTCKRIFVADCNNHRILIVDEDLIYIGEINAKGDVIGEINAKDEFDLPHRLYFDSSTDRLFVGFRRTNQLLVVRSSVPKAVCK